MPAWRATALCRCAFVCSCSCSRNNSGPLTRPLTRLFFYRCLPNFQTFLGDFNPQTLPSRRLQTLWEWKNRVLLEEYYIFNVLIPLEVEESRVMEVIINWVQYLGPPGPFSFPDSRDLLEVLGGLPWQRESPGEDPLGSGRIPGTPLSLCQESPPRTSRGSRESGKEKGPGGPRY